MRISPSYHTIAGCIGAAATVLPIVIMKWVFWHFAPQLWWLYGALVVAWAFTVPWFILRISERLAHGTVILYAFIVAWFLTVKYRLQLRETE